MNWNVVFWISFWLAAFWLGMLISGTHHYALLCFSATGSLAIVSLIKMRTRKRRHERRYL